MSKTAAIELKGISKHFGSVQANRNVDLTVYNGEILAILGENGSGKTTLMNMISGIYYPDEGSICIGGREAQISSPKDAVRYRIGMIHQHFKLVDVFTAAENGPVSKNLLPEALVKTYDSELDYTQSLNRFDITKSLQEEIKWATCIVIGPGIGTAEPAGIMLDEVLKEKNKAVVIDADGLYVLAI